jgi:hypothetical protein
MTVSVDFSNASSRSLQFMFSQKIKQVVSTPVVKEISKPIVEEKPKAHVFKQSDITSMEVKKLKAIYLALKKSGRYDQTDLNRIEMRLKDLK